MKTAVILAGGMGNRLRPLTLEIPKALIPVQGKTLTEKVIEKLKDIDIKIIYLSIGYMSDKIIEYFKDKDLGVEIRFLIEDEPSGTGGWMHLIERINEDFIVVNGDNLFDLDWDKMLKVHKDNKALITIGLSEVEDVTSRGVVDLGGNRIKRFVEKPKKEEASSNLISSGYYLFSKDVFNEIPSSKKFMLETELFPKVAEKGRLFGYWDKGQWFDTGTFERWERVIREWKNV